MAEFSHQQNIHLRDYVDIIKRRRLPIISLFFVIVCLVSLYTFLTTKQYTSKVRILIEQGGQRSFSIQEALAIDSTSVEFYQTQYKLIESRALAEKVVATLKLANLYEFGAPRLGEMTDKKLTEQQIERKAVDIFLDKISVLPIRQTSLVDITFTSFDPFLATKVANAIAKAYVDYVLDRRLKISQMAVTFLARRIDEQRLKVQASQMALQKYMEDNKLVEVISDDYNTIISNKLAELNQKAIEAETSRNEAETRYKLALKARDDIQKLDSMREFLDSPVIQKVSERELELSKKEAELSQKYGSKHPSIIALRAEKNAIARERGDEVNKIINSLENQYQIALAKEKAIRRALEKQKLEAMITRKKAIGFNVIKRENDTNQQLYDMLLSRAKEARITEEIDVGSVTVVDKAEVPETPSYPNIKLNLSLAIVGGFVISLFMGFLLEYMDNTIKFPSQIEEQLGLPLLGNVPFVPVLRTDRGQRVKGGNIKVPEFAELDMNILEPFRVVITAIMLSRAETPPRTIVVSSSLEKEGKSIIVASLAAAFSETNRKTLVIDCDMRKPRQHILWKCDNSVGLSTVISGHSSLKDCVKRGIMNNVDLITSGPIPPNPSELLQSETMSRVVELANKTYDQILIDSPPILPLADPLVLGRLADGLVLVAAAAKIPTHLLVQSAKKLEKTGVNLLGVVLNQTVKIRSDYYYSGYKNRYYYEYGYAEKKAS